MRCEVVSTLIGLVLAFVGLVPLSEAEPMPLTPVVGEVTCGIDSGCGCSTPVPVALPSFEST